MRRSSDENRVNGDISPAEFDRLIGLDDVDDTSWLPNDFVVEGQSPSVGSYTIGVPGQGFVLVDKSDSTVKSFDLSGRQIPQTELGFDAPRAVERFDPIAGALVADPLSEGDVEPAKGQEEALETTALPDRVVFRVEGGTGAIDRMRHLLRLPGRVNGGE
jgi:hypothetical protein